MDELTKRNVLALSEGLKEVRQTSAKQHDLIVALSGRMSMLEQQNQQLIVQQNSLLARIHGHGATTGR